MERQKTKHLTHALCAEQQVTQSNLCHVWGSLGQWESGHVPVGTISRQLEALELHLQPEDVVAEKGDDFTMRK